MEQVASASHQPRGMCIRPLPSAGPCPLSSTARRSSRPPAPSHAVPWQPAARSFCAPDTPHLSHPRRRKRSLLSAPAAAASPPVGYGILEEKGRREPRRQSCSFDARLVIREPHAANAENLGRRAPPYHGARANMGEFSPARPERASNEREREERSSSMSCRRVLRIDLATVRALAPARAYAIIVLPHPTSRSLPSPNAIPRRSGTVCSPRFSPTFPHRAAIWIVWLQLARDARSLETPSPPGRR